MKKRDRRQTPTSTSLAAGWSDAIPESMGPSEKMIDTTSDFYLKGEGTSKEKSRDKHNEIISKEIISKSINSMDMNLSHPNPKNTVSVFGPDKKRLKNTTQSKAKKWIKQGKAKQVKDKFRPGEIQTVVLLCLHYQAGQEDG